jgi:hypothetical protein
VQLSATRIDEGELLVTWVRRSRVGWAWIDEVEVPLGESREAYRVTLEGALGRIEAETSTSVLAVPAADLAILGSGQLMMSVQQIGDLGASRPATMTINL